MRLKCISKGPLHWLEVGRFYTIKKEGGIWWVTKWHFPLSDEALKECFGFVEEKQESDAWKDFLKYVKRM